MIRMGDQSWDLIEKLEKDSSHDQSLRAEVGRLNRRILELEKLEDAFGKSKQECCSLRSILEQERSISKRLSNDVGSLKARIGELEAIGEQLEKTEFTLKEDVTKLKKLTVMLVDERKTMTEKTKLLEDKLQSSFLELHTEQAKATSVMEKLREESKRALRSKAELKEEVCRMTKDRDELKEKLKAEEERSNDLQSKLSMMKERLQSLEAMETEFMRRRAEEELFQRDDTKTNELDREVERLIKEMVEEDLLKTEDETDSLDERNSSEKQRAEGLLGEVGISSKELFKCQLEEKEQSNEKHILNKRQKEEEAENSQLTGKVIALHEKVHEYVDTEEPMCRIKTGNELSQRKPAQQKAMDTELVREMENLTRELERYRLISTSHWVGMNEKDRHVSSRGVQTDLTDSQPPDYKSLAPLGQVVLNANLHKERDSVDDPDYNNKLPLTKDCAALFDNMNLSIKRSRVICSNSTVNNQNIVHCKVGPREKKDHTKQKDMTATRSPGKPPQIKVTPDHGRHLAMLKITSPIIENSPSYTSTALIPTSGGQPKQRITVIQNTSISSCSRSQRSVSSDGFCLHSQSTCPLSEATSDCTPAPDHPEQAESPTQRAPVTTSTPKQPCSKEPVEVVGQQALVQIAPGRQKSREVQRSSSAGSNFITTEDNRIHIHLGRAIKRTVNSISQSKNASFTFAQEYRSPVLTNGNPAKGSNVITSSITIKPAASSSRRPSQITVSNF